MGLIGWIVVGLVAGGLARMVTGAPKRGCLLTMAVGLIGALIGGALADVAFDEKISRFGLKSIAISFVGACIFLLILQALAGDRFRSR